MRGTLMQAPLAIIGSALAFLSWWIDKDPTWIIGGVLLLVVVPFTLIVMFPINRELERITLEEPSKADRLLQRWGALHAVRAGVSFTAFVVLLFALHHRT